MLYQLMNKDVVVATYKEEQRLTDCRYEEVERLDDYFPYAFADINDWIDGRQIARHRTSIEKLMRDLGLTTRHDFIGMVRAVLTPAIRSKLIELKDFEYTDPGFEYPAWKLDAMNRLKNRQIQKLLE